MKTLPLLLVVFLAAYARAGVYYPSSITDTTSTHSTDQPISCLSVKDQSGTQDGWLKYIEFASTSAVYSGVIYTSVGSAVSISSAVLALNFRGAMNTEQGFKFYILLNQQGSTAQQWVLIGDTSANTKGWAAWTSTSITIDVDFTRVLDANNKIQIKLTANKASDNFQLDYFQLTTTEGSSQPTTSSPTTATPTTTPTTTSSTTAPTTTTPTTASTAAPTTASTAAPTTASTAAPSTTTTTTTSTKSPVTTSTASPTTGPTALEFDLRVVIFSTAKGVNLDVSKVAFDSMGMAYDVVTASATTDLSSYLSTSGVGAYSGIVIAGFTASAAQLTVITNYQVKYGVRLVVFGSKPAGLPGMTAGTAITAKGKLSISTQFSKYARCYKSGMSVDSAASEPWTDLGAAAITPAVINDNTKATPAILYNGAQVAAAEVITASGTRQLHYFVAQSKSYLHSLVLAPLMVNWISPGGVFLGSRRLNFVIQPDDLFQASFLWNNNTHKNPLSNSLTYRITPADLQAAADYTDAKSASLPAGSDLRIEWPYNGAGTTWYTQPDQLFPAAKRLQNRFWFVTHTYTHPCDFDTATYDAVYKELADNIAFTPSLLDGGMNSPRLSPHSMVNPCITGLFNPNCLRAMHDNGIENCVGDNSVAKLVPPNLYHGIYTTVAVHGYAGMFIIPREILDIDYDNTDNYEFIDQWNTENKLKETFEQSMTRQRDYGLYGKVAFRQDPYMFHQANLKFFSYDDPVKGKITTSLTTLWMDRVLDEVTSYYNLPLTAPKMEDLAAVWKERTAMDACGITIKLQLSSSNQITSLVASSTATCVARVSGINVASSSTVRTDTSGTEITAYISMTAGVSQTLVLTTPISI